MSTHAKIDPCPCGSGKKRKNCHSSIPELNNVAGFYTDPRMRKFVVITKDILTNQIYREGPLIARSFDKIAKKDINAVSSLYGEITSMFSPHFLGAEPNDHRFRPTCANLLFYACNSFVASIQVARHGFRWQYGTIARSIVETLSVIIQLASDNTALEKFHQGKLDSGKSISFAKKSFPVLGPLYGLLSNHFVHIGPNHASSGPDDVYKLEDQDIAFIISNMRGVTFLIYLVAELVFFDEIKNPKYWDRINDFEYKTKITEETRRWQADILGVNIDEVEMEE